MGHIFDAEGHIVTPATAERQIQFAVDELTGVQVAISEPHHEIHEGDSSSTRHEFILKPNEKYVLTVTALSANANNITVSFDWYEN